MSNFSTAFPGAYNALHTYPLDTYLPLAIGRYSHFTTDWR